MWVVPSSIRSAFFQASECLTRESTPDLSSWASEAERSCSLNGKHTRYRSWLRAWKTDQYLQRLSGLAISVNSMQENFEAWWIASLADSRARTFHWPASAPDSTANAAASFSSCSALPKIAVRDTSFWRTSQASLVPPPPLWTKPKGLSTSARPPASWENWPTPNAMDHNMTNQPRTDGGQVQLTNAAGMWMTPNVPNGGRSVSAELVASKGTTADGEKRTVGLESQTKYWATPDCNTSTYSNGKMGPNIREQAASWNANSAATNSQNAADATDAPTANATGWPTQRGSDGIKGGPNQAGSKGDLMLPSAQWPTPSAAVMNDGESPATWHARAALLKEKHGNGNGAGLPLTVAAAQWPTPRTTDTNQGRGAELIGTAYYRPSPALKSGILVGQANLSDVVQQWPTPAARDSKGANSEQHALVTGGGRKHMDQLSNFVAHSSHQAQPMPDGPTSSPDGHGSPQPSTKRLNPYFTEWLMGWPAGWSSATALPASSAAAMESYRFRLRQQLSCLFTE